MNTIPRREFGLALAAGMERAGERLSPDDVAALHNVVVNAERFSTNYAPSGMEGSLNVGCPGSQAGLIGPGHDTPLSQFAFGFDDALIAWWHRTGGYFKPLPASFEVV
jgi:hypothetical protein